MRRDLSILRPLVIVAILAGAARGEDPPRLKASWKEKDAGVVAFSADGRSLVSSGAEGYKLRDAETGDVRAVLAILPYSLHGLRFAPDGKLVLAKMRSSEHKPVTTYDLKAWDVATGRLHGTIPFISDSINGSTEHFDLSRDGKMLATLDNSERLPMQVKSGKMIIDGRDEIKTYYNANPGLPRVTLWNVADWKQTATLDGGSHMVFSPDGTTLATGSRDWKVPVAKAWDIATGKLRAELVGKAQWVKPMAFSPDGKFLAIGGPDDETLWELASGKKWMVPVGKYGHQDPVFSPDGVLLFPNGLPGKIYSMNMNQEFPCYDVSSLPPARRRIGDGEVVVQPLTHREPRLVVSLAAMRYASFSEADSQGQRTLTIHGLSDGRVLGKGRVEGLSEADFSPDGRWLGLLVFGRTAGDGGVAAKAGMEIQLLDPTTARLLATVPSPGQTWGNPGWRFSPDGNSLAVWYRTGSNMYRPGEPEPGDRPMAAEVWRLPPR